MPDLRASDCEREAAVARLRAHHLAGRLDHDELEERAAAAHRARTRGELAALEDDLPDLAEDTAPAAGQAVERAVPRWPGVREFAEHHDLAVPAAQAYDDAFDQLVPAMARHGYRLAGHDGRTLHFQLRRRPAWTFALAVLVFPIGLVALLHQIEEDVVVRVTAQGDDRCRLTAHGAAPLPVRQAFARLSA